VKPCIERGLREILLKVQNKDLLQQILEAVEPCAEDEDEIVSQVTEKLVGDADLSCLERMDRVKDNIGKMKQLIKAGAPTELYERLNLTFLDIGKCGTPEFVKQTNRIFSEIRHVTKDNYFKGEGMALNRKLDELARQFDTTCMESGCMLPKPREVPLTVGERLEKIGLVELNPKPVFKKVIL
jgi:hypothetical protein